MQEHTEAFCAWHPDWGVSLRSMSADAHGVANTWPNGNLENGWRVVRVKIEVEDQGQ